MSLSVLGLSLSSLLFGFSETATMAVALRFLAGLLGAGIFVPGVKLVSSWFNSDERGTALGILNIGGSTGMILASWFVPLLSNDLGCARVGASARRRTLVRLGFPSWLVPQLL